MNKVDSMLDIFGITFNESFELLDSDNTYIGTYMITKESNNDFNLKKCNLKTNRWITVNDEILARMMLNIIKGKNKIKPLNVNQIEEIKPIIYKCNKSNRDYPIYIEKTVEDNGHMIIFYINQNDEHKAKSLASYENHSNHKKFCFFGSTSRRLYENYTGPLILTGIPMEQQISIRKIAHKYGTILK